MTRADCVRWFVAVGLIGLCGVDALGEPQVVKVVEDFEGPGVDRLWTPVAGAPVGRGAGATGNVFRNWGGFALDTPGVPEGADGLSFWVRTDDGETAAIDLALFEARVVEGRRRQTEAWGSHFWATPTWQKFTVPLAGLKVVWAWKSNGRLDREEAKYQVTTLFLCVKPDGGPGVLMAKPVYNVYRMLNYLDEDHLAVSGADFGDPVRAIATIAGDGSRLAILVYRHESADTATSGPSRNVGLTVRNLPFSGSMKVSHYAIDTAHSDVYAAWETLGAPARREITAAQIEQIGAHSDLETAAPAKRVTGLKRGDDWSTKLRLDPHGVALLVLTPLSGEGRTTSAFRPLGNN